ncbi:unnamed protein product, partial [Mesorhabditis spiculigera]
TLHLSLPGRLARLPDVPHCTETGTREIAGSHSSTCLKTSTKCTSCPSSTAVS